MGSSWHADRWHMAQSLSSTPHHVGQPPPRGSVVTARARRLAQSRCVDGHSPSWSLHTRHLLSCGMQSPVLGLRGVLAQRQWWEKRPGLRVPIGGVVGLGGGFGVEIFAVDACLVGPADGGAAWPVSGASSGGVAVFWR